MDGHHIFIYPEKGGQTSKICDKIPYEYIIKNGYLILKKKKLSEQYKINGTVIDAYTNKALIAASVVIENTNKGTFSNDDGSFSFSLSPGNYMVVCSYLGYKTAVSEMNLFDDKEINFVLIPVNKELSEVRIVEDRLHYE